MRRFGSVRLRVTVAAAGLFAVALTLASFWLVRSVHDNLSDEIAATTILTAVHLDTKARRATPFPAEFRARAEALVISANG